MKDVVYDSKQKIHAYWEWCDKLRSLGISTGDQKIIGQFETALHCNGDELLKALKVYAWKIGAIGTRQEGIMPQWPEPCNGCTYGEKPNSNTCWTCRSHLRWPLFTPK